MTWSAKDTANDASVMHHILEALEMDIASALLHLPEYDEVAKKAESVEDLIQHYVDAGNVEAVRLIGAMDTVQGLHEVAHDVMGGKGIRAISDEDMKQIAMDWFESDGFKDKYKRLIRTYGMEHVKEELGVE